MTRFLGLPLRLAVAGALSYGVLESAACLLRPPLLPFGPDTHWVEATPYLSGSMNFEILTNNYGFRNNADFAFPLKKRGPHVLLIGDSMMFGGPNTRTIDVYLSSLLPGHVIFNGSSPGAGPEFYHDMLEEYVERLKADYTFVGLFLGNDFTGPLPTQRAAPRFRLIQTAKRVFPNTLSLMQRISVKRGSRNGRETVEPIDSKALQDQTIEEVRMLARGLSLDESSYVALAQRYDFSGLLSRYPSLAYSKCAQVVAYAIIYRKDLADTILLRNPNALQNYMTALRHVQATQAYASRHGRGDRLVFVLFPISFMMHDDYSTFYRELGYAIPPSAVHYPLYDRLRRDLQEGGYRVLDLHQALRARPVFFREDWHLNEEGNYLVAAEIAHALAALRSARPLASP